MGAYIAKAGLQPDFALVSSARRTQETWGLVAPELKAPCPSRTVPSIYEADPSIILAAIRRAPQESETLLVIGHNPGLEGLASLLAPTGEAESITRLKIKYPTAGLAVIALDIGRWTEAAPGTGRLEMFATPKTAQ